MIRTSEENERRSLAEPGPGSTEETAGCEQLLQPGEMASQPMGGESSTSSPSDSQPPWDVPWVPTLFFPLTL